LQEIQSADKPTIMVFNKIDAYNHLTIDEDDLVTEKTKAHYSLDEWKKTYLNKGRDKAIFISALEKII
jgi:GTP-binding protein HflX